MIDHQRKVFVPVGDGGATVLMELVVNLLRTIGRGGAIVFFACANRIDAIILPGTEYRTNRKGTIRKSFEEFHVLVSGGKGDGIPVLYCLLKVFGRIRVDGQTSKEAKEAEEACQHDIEEMDWKKVQERL